MKKILCCAFALFMMFGVSGCGGSKPSDMSDENYDIANKILETADSFLDGDMSSEDAQSKIDLLSDQFEEEEDPNGTLLGTLSDLLSRDILKSGAGSSMDDVKSARDELAKKIGK